MFARRRLLLALKVFQAVVTGLIACAAYIKDAGPPLQAPPGLRAHLYAEFATWYAYIMIGFVLLGLLSQASTIVLGSEEKERVRGALDTLVRACFPDVAEAERFHNRATLF